jgi:hypothetical protein
VQKFEVAKLLASYAWLYSREFDIVQRMERQLARHESLSARQFAFVVRTRQYVERRRDPVFFAGGSPGGGRRA